MANLFTKSMRDRNGMLLDAAEIVGQSFPLWKCNIEPNMSCIIRTDNSSITFILDNDGESLTATWWMKSMWDPDGTVLSDDILRNKTDIIGWVSMVKTDQINAGSN